MHSVYTNDIISDRVGIMLGSWKYVISRKLQSYYVVFSHIKLYSIFKEVTLSEGLTLFRVKMESFRTA